MSTLIVAISSTIIMCMSGPILDNKCPDNSKPLAVTLNILSATTDCPILEHEHWRNCITHWDSILELYTSEKQLFVLYPDGSIKKDDAFTIDQVSLEIYKSLAQLLKEIK